MVELWEKIEFKVGKRTLTYQVRSNYLLNVTIGISHTNNEIFQLLGIEDPAEFADSVYGYPCRQPNKDSFPEYCTDDIEAATRMVEVLQAKCKQVTKHQLRFGDYVYFRVGDCTLAYKVTNTHLHSDTHSNGEIFTRLELDKYAVCTQCYGYDAGYGSFPICQYEDFEALTRLVNYLQQKCREYNAKHDLPEDLKAKPEKIAPEYTRLEKAIEALKPPTSSLLSETTLLTSRKSNTCKF